MKLIQRFGSGSQYQQNYIDHFISFHKQYPRSFDEVWLATDYGYPPISVHKEHARLLGEAAERLRREGIGVSLQLSNSIGHGQYSCKNDCTGLCAPEVNARRLVGHDGVTADYCFCWNGEVFRRYIVDEVTAYVSAIHPNDLFIDDDFRPTNHAPVNFGCFCDSCIADFNAKHGLSLGREELVSRCYRDPDFRMLWIGFVRDGLSGLMGEICEAVRKASPETRVGLQGGAHGAYRGYGNGYLFDVMHRVTGHKPAWRGGGGFYEDSNPNRVFAKIHSIAYQNSILPSYVTMRCPEIENLPFSVFGKSPAGTALETALGLASGNTDVSYSMMMNVNETVDFYGQYFRLFSEQRAYYEALAEVSERTTATGLVYGMSKHIARMPLDEGDDFSDLSEPYKCSDMLWRCAMPVCFDDNGKDTVLLHPTAIRSMTDAELDALLTRNVITDGLGLAMINKRGFDTGAQAAPMSHSDLLFLSERVLPHKAQPKYNRELLTVSSFAKGDSFPSYLHTLDDTAEILGTYQSNPALPPFMPDGQYPYGVATAILHPKQGGRLAIFTYGLWKGNVPSVQRDRILDVCAYMGSPLSARVVSLHQAVMYVRADKETGKTRAVSVCNPTIGAASGITLEIKSPASEHFVFMGQYGPSCVLDFQKDGDTYRVTLPELAPYSLGTVFCR